MWPFALGGTRFCAGPEASDRGSIASQEKYLSPSTILVVGARAEAVRLCQFSLCTEPIIQVIPT